MTNKKIAPFFAAEVPLRHGRSSLSTWSKFPFGMVKVPFRHGQRGTSRQPKFPFDLAKVPPLRCSLVPRDAVSMLYFFVLKCTIVLGLMRINVVFAPSSVSTPWGPLSVRYFPRFVCSGFRQQPISAWPASSIGISSGWRGGTQQNSKLIVGCLGKNEYLCSCYDEHTILFGCCTAGFHGHRLGSETDAGRAQGKAG